MARRNPANPRYQKDAQVGKTRRSSASAKPKRAAGDSATQSSKSSSGKKERPKLLAPVPDDPGYRRWRKIWGGLLIAALVFSALAWWQQATPIGTYTLALAYGCIFTAFYVDFTKLRRLRKAAIEAEKARLAGKKVDTKKGEAKQGESKKSSDKGGDTKPPSDSDA
jgi:Flp pilus assembly protein TadB